MLEIQKKYEHAFCSRCNRLTMVRQAIEKTKKNRKHPDLAGYYCTPCAETVCATGIAKVKA